MKKPIIITYFALTLFSINANAQYDPIRDTIRHVYYGSGNNLVSNKGLNIFFARRVSNYLSGTGDLSLLKSYATYSSEDDKLTLGFNISNTTKDGERLRWILTPYAQTGIKNNFASIYSDGKWENDARIGLKFTIIGPGTINYYDSPRLLSTQNKMMKTKRLKIMNDLLSEVDADEASKQESYLDYKNNYRRYIIDKANEIFNSSPQSPLDIDQRDQRIFYSDIDNILNDLNIAKISYTIGNYSVYQNSIRLIKQNMLLLDVQPLLDYLTNPDTLKSKAKKSRVNFATQEADALDEPHAYSWSQDYWFSFWGFGPASKSEYRITPNYQTTFTKKQFYSWELNAQGNYLIDGVKGLALINLGLKFYNNNSAQADLLTKVDYNQDIFVPPFPVGQADTANSSQLDSNEGYIGDYKTFRTIAINGQIVVMGPWKDNFVNVGLSIKADKNFGTYNALSLKFGIPIKLKGEKSESPVNIEPQVRRTHSEGKWKTSIGINVGVPFTSLLK